MTAGSSAYSELLGTLIRLSAVSDSIYALIFSIRYGRLMLFLLVFRVIYL